MTDVDSLFSKSFSVYSDGTQPHQILCRSNKSRDQLLQNLCTSDNCSPDRTAEGGYRQGKNYVTYFEVVGLPKVHVKYYKNSRRS